MNRGGNRRFEAERTVFGPRQAIWSRLSSQRARRRSRAARTRSVIDQRHLFSLLGAVIAALVLSVAPAVAAPAAHAAKVKPHKLTKRQKATLRRQPRHALKPNPAVA